ANYFGDEVTLLLQKSNRIQTITALVSSPSPSTYGQSIVFTATVSAANSGIPTGSVTFRDGSSDLGTILLSGNSATLSTSSLGSGLHSITARYNGDSNFIPSTSPIVEQQVNQAPSSTSLSSSQNPSSIGASVTFSASVTGAGSIPTGTV